MYCLGKYRITVCECHSIQGKWKNRILVAELGKIELEMDCHVGIVRDADGVVPWNLCLCLCVRLC